MRKHKLLSNLSIVFITATVLTLVVFGFNIFKDQQVNSLNTITFAVLILNLFYQVIVRPQKPPEEKPQTYGDLK